MVRVSAELVQTPVTVLDKAGRFVEGLKPEQFQLKVDGQPVKVAFFERVTAAAGGAVANAGAAKRAGAGSSGVAPPGASERGRTVIFFIDDMHLSPQSVERTRKTISRFVETAMGPDDQVAIATASGQLGFLQQFADHKGVLRAALARLRHKSFAVRDAENISMTEYQALRIDQGDRDVFSYYTGQLMRDSSFKVPVTVGPPAGGPAASTKQGAGNRVPGLTKEGVERMVKERAQLFLRQTAAVNLNLLATLDSLMRSSAQLPRRKLVFFISDGFYLNERNTGFADSLRRITDAAVRARTVIYSLDARGLVGDTDASSNRNDPPGQVARGNVGELSASQDPLTALAEDTGGRATLNTAGFDAAVTRALDEASNYYLLAWRPEAPAQRGGKFRRVEVSVVNRPELTVRAPRGYFDAPPEQAAETKGASKTQPEARAESNKSAAAAGAAPLRAALTASAPRRSLPTLLDVSYPDTPANGAVLTASAQVAADALSHGPDGKQAAADLAGVVLNLDGKAVTQFATRLVVKPLGQAGKESGGVVYSHRAPLAPGLYQVRVAARDDGSGRVGSAMKWVEVPDLKSKALTLSSLLVGAQAAGGQQQQQQAAPQGQGAGAPALQFSVDRRFRRASRLSFMVFVYNAVAAAGGKPDLTAQVQVFHRSGQAIVNTPMRPLDVRDVTDTARVPFVGSFPLQSLPPGRYALQVNVEDRAAKTRAT